MHEYRTKPIRVEAHQWDPKGDRLTQPYWFAGAIDFTCNSTHGKIKIIRENLQVVTASGTAIAGPGDWVVYWTTTDRSLEVVKQEDFKRRFDKDERWRGKLRSWNDDKKNPTT